MDEIIKGQQYLNRTLRIGTLPGTVGPFVQEHTTWNGQISYQGMVLQAIDAISKTMGFKYELILPSDNEYGVISSIGSFTGLVGMLQHKEIDIAASDLSVTLSRSEVINYSPPFYYDSYGILFNHPNASTSLGPFTWCNAFKWPLWLSFFTIFIFCVAILYYGQILAGSVVPANSKFQKFGTCTAYMLAGYVNRCYVQVSPLSWWAQTLLTFWWLLCLLESASYGSFLMATLTSPTPPQLPFHDLSGLASLVEKGQYKFCVRSGTSFSQTLLNANTGDYKILGTWLKSNPAYIQSGQEGCVGMLQRESNVAYLAEEYVLEAIQAKLCFQKTLVLLKGDFYDIQYSFGFQKNSSFTDDFNKQMVHLIENGFFQVWYQNYSRLSYTCPASTIGDIDLIRTKKQKLSLKHLFSVFVLLIFGLGLGILLLFGELVRCE